MELLVPYCRETAKKMHYDLYLTCATFGGREGRTKTLCAAKEKLCVGAEREGRRLCVWEM